MALEKNQKLWFVGEGNFSRKRGEVTVTSVGRKWAQVEGVFIGRVAVDTLIADAAGFSSPGRCYLSQEEWLAKDGPKLAWQSLRNRLSLACPTSLSYKDIVAAGNLLGFDVSVLNSEKS